MKGIDDRTAMKAEVLQIQIIFSRENHHVAYMKKIISAVGILDTLLLSQQKCSSSLKEEDIYGEIWSCVQGLFDTNG